VSWAVAADREAGLRVHLMGAVGQRVTGMRNGRLCVPHHGGVEDYEDFDRLSSAVYIAARAGAVDCAAAFDLAASWLEERPLACLEDAMRLVNRDVAATGIRRPCHLRVHDEGLNWSTNAYVETWDGYTGIADGIHPADGADPVSALVAVAEDAQDALMHALFAAWPVCPVHRLGAHASYHEEAAVWWCSGDGGHAVTAIGQWQVR
jgi:hypothetical protein